MPGKGKGKRLTEAERLEVIAKLSAAKPPSKRSLARAYDVSEAAIRKTWVNRENIARRTATMAEQTRKETQRFVTGRYTEIEDKLFVWIETMRHAKIAVPPSLAIGKAKQIAQQLEIPESDFKASWQWLSRFCTRRGLKEMHLHGEGAEVDKDNPELLAALDRLYEIIRPYAVENVYNMDETGLFFRLLPRYTVLLPMEDICTMRGKKKSKDRVSLIVCSNATGSHTIPFAMIGKAKRPACIVGREWPIPYFHQSKAWMDVGTWNLLEMVQ